MVERRVDVDFKGRSDVGDEAIAAVVAVDEVADAKVVEEQRHVARVGRKVDGSEPVEEERVALPEVAEERLQGSSVEVADRFAAGEAAWAGRKRHGQAAA